MIPAMSQAEIEDCKLDATLTEFFDRKRVDFYDWVSQLVKREVAERVAVSCAHRTLQLLRSAADLLSRSFATHSVYRLSRTFSCTSRGHCVRRILAYRPSFQHLPHPFTGRGPILWI
jgi:hypothetical protein